LQQAINSGKPAGFPAKLKFYQKTRVSNLSRSTRLSR
jgi:hypothetical protein